MLEELDLTNMPLTAVLRDWMVANDWKDELEISEDGNKARVATIYLVNDQDHRVYLEVDEKADEFSVFVYSPFNVPGRRRAEVLDLINRIHGRTRLGRFWCSTDEEAKPLQFKITTDVEGAILSPEQIDVMIGSAVGTLKRYGSVLATVAMTDTSAAEAWSAHRAAEETNQQEEEVLGPAEL
jgi:hypothetical protein